MNDQDLKKLKNFAFQSGYPLENDVEKILEGIKHKGDWSLLRDFAFGVSDEANTPKYRSIDFICTLEYSKTMLGATALRHDLRARLHFVVETKWIDERSQWWMRPRPIPSVEAETFPFLVPILDRCINRYEVQFRSAALVGNSYKIAQSGRKVSLAGSSESIDRESLVSHQVQLIQGAMAFLEERVRYWGDGGLNDQTGISPLEIFVPVIATNAPLELLHTDLTSDKVLSSQNKENICRREACLQLEFPMLSHLFDSVKSSMVAVCNDKRLRWQNPVVSRPLMPTMISSVDGLPAFIQSRVDQFEESLGRCTNEIFDYPVSRSWPAVNRLLEGSKL